MSLRGPLSVCAALLLGVAGAWAQEQLPSTPQPQPNAGQQQASPAPSSDPSSSKQTAADQQQTSDDQTDQQNTDKKQPSKIKRALKRAAPNCINLPGNQSCWDRNPREKEQDAADERERRDRDAQEQAPRNQSPPRSSSPEGQSSSNETRIDLTPPSDDMKHEGADVTGVTEFHAYDPHKAAKNVEVGDFYFKRKNYKAAESRYAEALEWKPNDAVALFRLAEAQAQLGKKEDAVKNYQAYLKILPQGEFATDAKNSIAKLEK
jgi:tetratricopeptide (TPR) repeat protein